MNIVLVSHTAHCQRWQGNLRSWVPAGFHQFVPLSQASTCIYLRAESGEPNSHLTHLTWICEQSNNGKRQSCMLLRRGAITVWCNSHKPGRDVTSSDTATILGRSLLFQSLLQIHFSEYLYLKSRQTMDKRLSHQWRLDLTSLLHSCQVKSLLQVSRGDFYFCLMFESAKVGGRRQRWYKQQRSRWQTCI